MQVDAPQAGPVQAAKKGSTRPGSPATAGAGSKKDEELIPEVDIYVTLLVIVHLLDAKELEKVRTSSVEAYDDVC